MRALALVAAIGIALTSSSALACRCSGPEPGAEALAEADVALIGQVVDREGGQGGTTRFVLRVTHAIRGLEEGTETLEVHTPATSCGFGYLATGEEWLVFARRDGDALVTRKCTGTVRLREAGGERSARAERWVRATLRAARR
jgi:hypothetical protein